MRETDQAEWLIKFGKGECTEAELKAKSDESRELFVADLKTKFKDLYLNAAVKHTNKQGQIWYMELAEFVEAL